MRGPKLRQTVIKIVGALGHGLSDQPPEQLARLQIEGLGQSTKPLALLGVDANPQGFGTTRSGSGAFRRHFE